MCVPLSNFPPHLPNCHSSVGLPLIVSGSEPYCIDPGKAAVGNEDTCCKVIRLTDQEVAFHHKAVLCVV